MTTFAEFLSERLAEFGALPTEDVLASFLPLGRQVAEAHSAGRVAPLDGIEALQIDGVRIWYEQSRETLPRKNHVALKKFQPKTKNVDIRTERRITRDVDAGEVQGDRLDLAKRGEEITCPVYLPGYVCWEHEVEHHDPLTDTYCLGLILASMACGIDFNDEVQLAAFVEHRENLFALNAGLHPVLSQAIVAMTHLDRRRRPQDLAALLNALENYREQSVDFALELTRVEGFEGRDRRGKQQVVLSKLQERLFEVSRRNRLLHFRPTMHTVNLTHASVPLSIDIRNIRNDQIVTWGGRFLKDLLSQDPVPLNRYLNFREAVYLPGVLDGIRIEASRDGKEFGFAQLRLVVAFLRWSNLKESPPELYQSPFILLPVELTCKKGVQDTHVLRLLSTDAEVNPVVRYLFRQLYGIELPESIDLASTTLEAFHEQLAAQVAASDRGVSVPCIDRPRIDVIHDKARRRLDLFRRRTRISGRGVKSFRNLDYSYDSVNYHPLGIRLFNEVVRPATTRLLEILTTSPPKPKYVAEPPETDVVEAKKSFFSLGDSDQNPFVWEFDLCNVTLANLKYRKMSLVRDYDVLTEGDSNNPAFDSVFSLSPKPVSETSPPPLPLDEQYHVVSCDPTQAQAIANARTNECYIIQGPPGTGKSQTITNLIADYLSRGKRVLFVCEKRAAIDVVYQRLKHRGLDELCCLIHDSQTDKKEFVMDLKKTYETFLDESQGRKNKHLRQRNKIVTAVSDALRPLQALHEAMTASPEAAGTNVHEMLSRLVELRDCVPELSPAELERFPTFAHWNANRSELDRLYESIREIQADGVLARHALANLANSVATRDRPIEFVTMQLVRSQKLLDELATQLGQVEWPPETDLTVTGIEEATLYATGAAFLAKKRLIQLTDLNSKVSLIFRDRIKALGKLRSAYEEKAKPAELWLRKLSREETRIALEQARTLESAWLPFLKPAWWRLRGLLQKSYNFAANRVRPSWVQALETLNNEHAALEDYEKEANEICEEFGMAPPMEEFSKRLRLFTESIGGRSESIQRLHAHLVAGENGGRTLRQIRELTAVVEKLNATLSEWLAVWKDRSLEDLRRNFANIEQSIGELPDYVHCLSQMESLDPQLSAALRSLPYSAAQMEAACAHRTLDAILRGDREFKRFDFRQREKQLELLQSAWRDWQSVNAETLCERIRQAFFQNAQITSLPAAQLTAEQKEFKKLYSRGRKELEHEFGKSMRHRAIRDLVAGDTGLVVRDLKPVWLMSPLSVSDTLPLDDGHFDVVIFDEASQITLEEAIPSLFRAKQAIVVGDEMQLPPTDFFSARRTEEDGLEFEDAGDVVKYDLNSDSLLNHAARNLPSRMLGWHYRSRSESLISFSNRCFYGGRLLTVPEQSVVASTRREIVVNDSDDAIANADELLDRAVSFHFVANGVYEKRQNRPEAEYIAKLVRELLRKEPRRSIGVVAFSEAQQEEIDQALRRLAAEDRPFAELLEAELERTDDGQFVGLLVKNLENIQGDERDIVIMSVCYGPDSQGHMRMNFGPINMSGGEKRLNVAFSRAKHHMALVSSMRYTAISNEYNEGANCLKNYLRYASAASIGDQGGVDVVLKSLTQLDEEESTGTTNVVAAQIADVLRSRGWLVDTNVGHSQFRCDLAVRAEEDNQYRLGILVDSAAWYAQTDLIERELMKPGLLTNFGWSIAVVLTKDWYLEPKKTLKRIEQSLAGQVEPETEPEDDAASTDEPLSETSQDSGADQ